VKLLSQTIRNFIKLSLLFFLVGSGFSWATIPQSGSLVAHYPFSGNANDNANSYDGTLVGSPTLTTDRHGSSNSAYLFDGVDDWIKFGVGSLSSGSGNPFTISVWAKSSNSATQDLVAFGGDHCSLRPMVIRLGSNLNFNSCNNGYDTSSGGSHNDGVWHHWVFTWNGSNQRKVYKDGSLESTSNSGQFNINTEGLVLGRRFIDLDGGTLFNGSADELRLWSVALTESEVSDLYTDENSSTPTISSVSSDKAAGSYKAGDVIDIDVVFSEAVTVTGTPQITLETGDTDQTIDYSSGSGTTTLTFNYTVQAGDIASDLDYTSTTALALNGGTIQSSGGDNATLTLPTVGGSDSLAGNEALVIDTTAPSVSSSATASVAENQTSAIDVNATDTNTITYSISGGDSASFSIDSSSGVVTFDSAPDYETKSSYSFTATATDTAGNTDTQSVTITVTDVDDANPTLSSSSPADGSTSFNASSNITLTFSEAVDAESGNITLKKTSDDSTVETFNVTSDISGSGSTTITINPAVDLDNSTGYYLQIASTAFDDSSSNSYAGISDTTTLNFTTSSGDTTGPTMTITASGASSVADGSTSEDATLTMTFTSNEATSNFVVGDITVGNGTLSSFSTTSSTVYTATLTPTAQGAVTVEVAAGAFTDAASNSNTAATQFNWTYLSSPLNKTNVSASVKAMSGVAIDAVTMNFNAVENRLSWLSANARSSNLSHQGIRFNFANPTVDKLMNTAYVKPGKLQLNNEFVKLIRNNIKNGEAPEVSAITDDTKQGLSSVAYNEFAKVREDTIDKVLNATSNTKVMGDWNVWTEGRITVGKTYSTSSSSAQDSETQNISLGFDRIVKDDKHPEIGGHLIGVVLGIGKSDADTTNNSTVDADSYSFSAYGVIRQNDKDLAQAMMGYGHINVDKTRIDGSDTLTGTHDANQFFTSLMFKQKTVNVGSFSLSPYGKIHASRTWYDGYSETGGATALTYGEQTIDSTVLSAGVDADYLIPIHKGNIRPFMKFEYGADVSGSSTVNMHYNNETTNYQLQLDNKADSNWKFVLGTDLYTEDEWDSSFSYERTEAVNAGYSDSLAVKVGLKF